MNYKSFEVLTFPPCQVVCRSCWIVQKMMSNVDLIWQETVLPVWFHLSSKWQGIPNFLTFSSNAAFFVLFLQDSPDSWIEGIIATTIYMSWMLMVYSVFDGHNYFLRWFMASHLICTLICCVLIVCSWPDEYQHLWRQFLRQLTSLVPS